MDECTYGEEGMKILVDADACPVIDQIIKVSKEATIEVHLFADRNHQFNDVDAQIHYVDQGSDFADFALVNEVNVGDVVVTADYGLAAMVLAKKGRVMSHNGREITSDNIDQHLNARHIHRQERKKGHRGPRFKKRQGSDNEKFYEAFKKIVI